MDGTPEAVITEHCERPKKRARMRSGADEKYGKIQRWREAEMRKGQRGSWRWIKKEREKSMTANRHMAFLPEGSHSSYSSICFPPRQNGKNPMREMCEVINNDKSSSVLLTALLIFLTLYTFFSIQEWQYIYMDNHTDKKAEFSQTFYENKTSRNIQAGTVRMGKKNIMHCIMPHEIIIYV